MRDIAGTDRQGTSAYGLVKVIEHFGFQQKVVEADKSVLTNKLPLPAIAHVIIDNSLLHYVVITKVKGDTVVVFDPAKVLYVTFNYYEVNLTQCILISLLIRMN
uniref:cysteine peptidase family C39 domain-containing protein n=1 Tax=uncultured Ruminococcus sp. TaxID=165186 RepID=UPI0025F2A91C|nr:cysteine peptidase family C39 domain-containing protein [uncultured Ruminococcus sp.]